MTLCVRLIQRDARSAARNTNLQNQLLGDHLACATQTRLV